MPKAVLFDMYETLATLHAGTPYFGAEMADDLAIPRDVFLPLWRATDEMRTRGLTDTETVLRQIVRDVGKADEPRLRAVIARREREKQDCFRHLHPGVLPMLAALREWGVAVGLVSNCYQEEAQAIRQSPLAPYFDAMVLSCELGVCKPDPAIFLRCTELLHVSPADCLYVGDGGSRELQTARELHMDARQARWYLRPGSRQEMGPLDDFPSLNDPADVLSAFT